MVKIKFSKGKFPKKYKAVVIFKSGKTKTTSFGDVRYGQFRDTTPLKLYKNKDTLDKKKKKNYFNRHKKNYPIYSADWFSKKYLWS